MIMYKRKTIDTWELHVNYGYAHSFENEITEYTRQEIKQRVKEYKENVPQYALKVIKKREKLVDNNLKG